jgi:AbrB family looped-hinge helix DNA binding protein
MSQTQSRIPVHSIRTRNGGRVTIPKTARDRYEELTGDEVGNILRFELLEPGSGHAFEAKIDDNYRIYIPSRFRQRYDIESGDYVDMDIIVGGGE